MRCGFHTASRTGAGLEQTLLARVISIPPPSGLLHRSSQLDWPLGYLALASSEHLALVSPSVVSRRCRSIGGRFVLLLFDGATGWLADELVGDVESAREGDARADAEGVIGEGSDAAGRTSRS